MTTELDKNFMLTSKTLLSEPFDFGRKESDFPQDSINSSPGKERAESNSDPSDSSLLLQFAVETSAHGCAHVTSSTRGTWWRGLWALAVFGMLGAMIFTLYCMLAAYDEYPVNTATKVKVESALPFPGVTLCNINEVDVDLVPVNGTVFRSTRTELLVGRPVDENDIEVSRVMNISLQDMVNSSWILPDQAILACFINNKQVPCWDIFSTIQSSRSRCVTLNTEYPSLKLMSNVGPISGLRLYIFIHQSGYVYDNSVSAGLKMYIHEPRQQPDLQSSGILLSPGFSHYVGVRRVQYSFLPQPYKAFGNEACSDVNDPSFSRPLRLTERYSFHICNLECTLEEVAERCGCRGVLNSENSSVPMCSMRSFYSCYDPLLSDVSFNVTSDNRCACPRPCQYSEYRTDMSSAYFPSDVATATLQSFGILPVMGVRENFMELRVYLDKLMWEEVVHEPVYTYISVMGTIGGQMGFFLGASVLTVAEVLELVVCFLFRFLRRISGPTRHIAKSQVIPVQKKNPATEAS